MTPFSIMHISCYCLRSFHYVIQVRSSSQCMISIRFGTFYISNLQNQDSIRYLTWFSRTRFWQFCTGSILEGTGSSFRLSWHILRFMFYIEFHFHHMSTLLGMVCMYFLYLGIVLVCILSIDHHTIRIFHSFQCSYCKH